MLVLPTVGCKSLATGGRVPAALPAVPAAVLGDTAFQGSKSLYLPLPPVSQYKMRNDAFIFYLLAVFKMLQPNIMKAQLVWSL